MATQNTTKPQENIPAQISVQPSAKNQRQDLHRGARPWWLLIAILTYMVGLASGYGLWGPKTTSEHLAKAAQTEYATLVEQINPKDGYVLPVDFGDLGPQMMAAGVFDREQFIQVYQQANQPLTDEHMVMLDGTYEGQVVVNSKNSYFLLNFLWALGLSNKNEILDSGVIQTAGKNGFEGFASTGGWTLTTRPIREIFSASRMLVLTEEQQDRLEEAAAAIFRPCCDNPTHFPDCNHGMAMLGLLELMASQNTSLDKMMEAAKYVNAFWYPKQTMEQAVYFQKTGDKAYQDVDAELILGRQYSSLSGFRQINQILETNEWLPQAPSGGGSCSV